MAGARGPIGRRDRLGEVISRSDSADSLTGVETILGDLEDTLPMGEKESGAVVGIVVDMPGYPLPRESIE